MVIGTAKNSSYSASPQEFMQQMKEELDDEIMQKIQSVLAHFKCVAVFVCTPIFLLSFLCHAQDTQGCSPFGRISDRHSGREGRMDTSVVALRCVSTEGATSELSQ